MFIGLAIGIAMLFAACDFDYFSDPDINGGENATQTAADTHNEIQLFSKRQLATSDGEDRTPSTQNHEVDCETSEMCKTDGWCGSSGSSCHVRNSTDCERSRRCQTEGRCGVPIDSQRCQPLTKSDCGRSENCKRFKRCEIRQTTAGNFCFGSDREVEVGLLRGADVEPVWEPGPGSTMKTSDLRDPRRIPKVKFGRPIFSRGCDEKRIARVIRDKASVIEYCYRSQLSRDQELAGELSLVWGIGTDGRAQTIEVLESTLNNESVTGCFKRSIKRIDFGKTERECQVTYPIRVWGI